MSDYKVTYFDFSGSRGEEVRLALAIAGVDFDDDRIPRASFDGRKSEFPFAALPVLDIAGHGRFAQSNAILRLIGRLHGLYPEEPFDAARHDALMEAAEEMRQKVSATMRIPNEAQRMATRGQLAGEYLPNWARGVEMHIGDGPFVGGAAPGVADVKLYMVHRWIAGGTVDGIAEDTFAPYEAFTALAEGVARHPAVVAWYARPH